MGKMDELNREQLENIADVLSSLLLEFVDAQTAERLLRANGFDDEALKALCFDTEVE